jgi:hypothetical protein
MFPMLPTSAQSDLAGALLRFNHSRKTLEPFGDHKALAPDPIFMALRSFASRLRQILQRDGDDEIFVTPVPGSAASSIAQHSACD